MSFNAKDIGWNSWTGVSFPYCTYVDCEGRKIFVYIYNIIFTKTCTNRVRLGFSVWSLRNNIRFSFRKRVRLKKQKGKWCAGKTKPAKSGWRWEYTTRKSPILMCVETRVYYIVIARTGNVYIHIYLFRTDRRGRWIYGRVVHGGPPATVDSFRMSALFVSVHRSTV